MNELEQLTITVDRLTKAVEALESKAEADRELVETLVKQIKYTRRSDRQQQHEINWLKRVMLGVVALMASSFIASEKYRSIGEEDISNLIEILGVIFGGGIAVTAASQQAKPNAVESEDEDE